MNISSIFIKRPIATVLISIGIALGGILAFKILPVASLPQVEIPIIMVQATLSGASPEIMASSVATPLEKSFSRIAGITDITSSSTLGNSKIIIQFDMAKDSDTAAREVQAAIDATASSLPDNMISKPIYKKVNPADAPIMILALTSETYKIEQLFDMASSVLQQKLLRVDGVGQVIAAGSSLPAVRVDLNPTKMMHYGISFNQVSSLINRHNMTSPKGQLSDGDYSFEIVTNDEIFKAEDYANLVVSNKDNRIVRLSDIAQVKESVQELRNSGSFNGKRAVLLVIFKQPSANVVKINSTINDELPDLKKLVPAGVEISKVMDRSLTIKASLKDVEKTLVHSVLFVILVVFIFLGNTRSTVIPGVALILSILGTFSIMSLLGYSLNSLSLMALTIATGFVVDDAIVVLENISRYIEQGMKPKEAAFKGSKEIGFTVLSISISLIAVFIPLLLMGGIVGRLFREFAVTLSVAILISLLVSLALSPMMCAYILKDNLNQSEHDSIFHKFVTKMKNGYEISLRWALNHQKLVLWLFAATIGLNIYLYAVVPKGFFPQQDTGRIISTVITDQNSSFHRLNSNFDTLVKLIKTDEAIENVVGYISSGSINTGTIFIILKDLKIRKVSADIVLDRLRKKLANLSGATIYMQSAQDLVIGGRQSNAQFQYTVSADNLNDVNKYTPMIQDRLENIYGIVDISSDQGDNGLQSFVNIDYDKAIPYGVSAYNIDQALYSAFGQKSVSTMYGSANQYYVIMGLDSKYTKDPNALNLIYVSNNNGKLIPLSSFAKFDNKASLLSVAHQGLSPAATLSFNLLPNVHLGDAVNMVNKELASLKMPITVQGSFRGTAQAFQSSLKSQPYLILAALVTVYIVLGMLYESLLHPITILSTLPSAGVGALLALILTGMDLTIIALIGIILLIGIVKKNAIMMIDFVLEIEKHEKISPRDAIYKAAVLRFRPIMMTTMAALLGAVPMAIGTGLGSELQKPLGVSIIGGLIFSQMITLYTTPVIYLAFENLRLKRQKGK
jgi:multidrug efflux pump